MRTRDTLSPAEARRIALAAQGFAEPRPDSPCERRHLRRLLARIGLLQIDSVNVLVRSHYLPAFSRLGAYAPTLLEECAWGVGKRDLFEYWGHEASLIPIAMQPLFRWRMERAERGEGLYGGIARFARERPDYIGAALAEVTERGPMGASEFSLAGKSSGGWWGWSEGKIALEYLFWCGRVTTAGRRGFERLYDLPERVLPRAVLDTPTPEEEDAHRALTLTAAGALGIATERDLRDYFRLDPADSKRAVAALVEAGELLPVTVKGWDRPAYLHPDARCPRRVEAAALLSPFDSLVWERDRTERVFGFRYRLEIYTPAHKREHGYYVLPFLLGDRLVARVDLKSDRANGNLLVHAAHGEAGVDPTTVGPPLAAELRRLAGWLGLERVAVADRGDLAVALRSAAG